MRSSQKQIFVLIGVVIIFLAVWFLLAKHVAAWGDETAHMAAGKGLALTGAPQQWSFDEGKFVAPYWRGYVITYLSALIYPWGQGSLWVFRLTPLLFTLLTFVVFVIYVRRWQNASLELLTLAAILFFTQTFVMESSLYVRFYSSLGLLTLMSLIFYWEAVQRFVKKKNISAWGLLALSALAYTIPIIDHWQIQNFIIFAVAIPLSFERFRQGLGNHFNRYPKRWILFFGIIILTAPIVVIAADFLMSWALSTGMYRLNRAFVTYWDNIAGVIRLLIAVNVSWIGVLWVLRYPESLKQFHGWLFITGLLSAILTGLYAPINHIFYFRFFYVPVALTVLGLAGVLMSAIPENKKRNRVVLVYIAVCIFLSAVTFYYDRSNITLPIKWLNQNLKQNDVLLVFHAELELHGGRELVGRAEAIKADQREDQIQALIDRITRQDINSIYFLYSDHYQFREKLYEMTTGESRSPRNTLFHYLKENIPGEQILKRLRGCGLLRYSKEGLIAELVQLKRSGYPPQFKGIEKRIGRKILSVLKSE